MNLYRIILVDDEEEVRKSIIQKIQWEAVGFEVAGDAENGRDALEKLEVLEPDVVLTDIRMPYMDGLALAEKIHQKYPSMKVVIFSGYDDFEYAQRAIKLDVTEYILKPVNAEELTALLKKIRRSLDEEIEQRRDVSRLRESYRSSLPIIREHFLNDLVRGGLEEETISKNLVEYDIPIADAGQWVVAVVHVEKEEIGAGNTSFHREKELIPISVRQLVEEKLKGYCRFAACSVSSELAVIAALDGEESKNGLIDLLGDICRESRRVLEVSITVGIGCGSDSLTGINRSFKSAMNALGYAAIVGSGSTIYINDVEPVSRGKLQFDGTDESRLITAVKFGPEENIRGVIGELVGKMEDAPVHFRQYQAYLLGIVNTLTQLVQQYDLDLSEMFGAEMDYFEIFTNRPKREALQRWLLEATLRMNRAMNEARDNTTRNVIREARQYIQDHYQDPELSVEKICSHLHLSPAYFSTIFKKETGQAYIAYLTELRLNKAVELLNTTDDKTYLIAARVGYQEQNYFSYVFKKRFGVSPTKYRGVQK